MQVNADHDPDACQEVREQNEHDSHVERFDKRPDVVSLENTAQPLRQHLSKVVIVASVLAAS